MLRWAEELQSSIYKPYTAFCRRLNNKTFYKHRVDWVEKCRLMTTVCNM